MITQLNPRNRGPHGAPGGFPVGIGVIEVDRDSRRIHCLSRCHAVLGSLAARLAAEIAEHTGQPPNPPRAPAHLAHDMSERRQLPPQIRRVELDDARAANQPSATS